MKCESEDDVLQMLSTEDAAGGNGDSNGGNNNDDGCGVDSTDGGGRNCQLPPLLVHLPANLLHHPGDLVSATPQVFE